MGPPKILLLGANGLDITRLRLGTEVRDIRRELEATSVAEAFHLMAELAVWPGDLQRLLLLHDPNLIHCSGHGAIQIRLDCRNRGAFTGHSSFYETLSVFIIRDKSTPVLWFNLAIAVFDAWTLYSEVRFFGAV